MGRTYYQSTQNNPVINDNSKGFLDNTNLTELYKNCSDGYVLKGMEYRPDLVAMHYLGDPTKAWAITFVNNFFNGIKDYTLGKKLKIPNI